MFYWWRDHENCAIVNGQKSKEMSEVKYEVLKWWKVTNTINKFVILKLYTCNSFCLDCYSLTNAAGLFFVLIFRLGRSQFSILQTACKSQICQKVPNMSKSAKYVRNCTSLKPTRGSMSHLNGYSYKVRIVTITQDFSDLYMNRIFQLDYGCVHEY